MKTPAAILVAAFVTIAAAQGADLPARGASVSASTYKAGAKPVALTFKPRHAEAADRLAIRLRHRAVVERLVEDLVVDAHLPRDFTQ
jgi:hypothetical protein